MNATTGENGSAMGREPALLKRGKEFHARVQRDWKLTAQGSIHAEHGLPLLPGVSCTAGKRGRMDIFVDEVSGFVTVVEIKATDWDRVKVTNRRRLLGSHRRQVWRYLETYLERDGVDVCAGVIYPRPPAAPEAKAEIEAYLNEYGLQVVWYDE